MVVGFKLRDRRSGFRPLTRSLALVVGRAMVFVRKCASDCRLKYGLSPDPISARTPARLQPFAPVRTDRTEPGGLFGATPALLCGRPSTCQRSVGRSSPPRPAAPPAAPLCTTGGGIIENNRQTGDEREATCRSTDTQTQRAYASVHRSIAVTRPAASQHE